MYYGHPVNGLRIPTIVKSKVFVSYHHGGDQGYYDAFSRTFHDTYDVIYDNSLERRIDSEDVNYVMRRIRETCITGSSCTIVLVGAQTWGRKYVDWEINATLDKGHGLLGIVLPTAPSTLGGGPAFPLRLLDNLQSGFALWQTWQQLMADPTQLRHWVAEANARSTRLINNARARRLRNA